MNLAVVTNILTPYRIPLFAAMSKRVDRLHVLLMAEREENRDWALGAVPFECEVLPGFHLKLPEAEVAVHVNYGVMRALRRINPDAVLSGGFAPANATAWLYCRLHRRPFVGWGELSMQDVGKTPILKRGLRRVMTTWSNGTVASSSEAREVFAYYGARSERILTSIMPIDVEFFHAGAVGWRNSDWFHAERAHYPGPILVSVGRMVASKGYRELFAIYEIITKQQPDVSLLIVGDGPERIGHEALVQSRGWTHVHFLGFRQADEVVKYLALADLLVFHTLGDPFGAVLSEAMAAGVPVVSSIHAAATGDLVEEGVTGHRIDPRETDASAATVLKVLNMTPEARMAMGRAAYDRVKRCDIDTSADDIVRFIASLSRSSRSEGKGRLFGVR
jgi:glycosyltransferase involved in cell wall biosynthesis